MSMTSVRPSVRNFGRLTVIIYVVEEKVEIGT